MSFFELFQELVPPWLSSGEGGKNLAALALVKDDFAARAKLALLSRFPDYAPDDAALAAIGRGRGILRGLDEPATAYAARLKMALDAHRRRGSPYAMLEQIRAYLQQDCLVRTVDRRGNWFSIAPGGARSSNINTGNWGWYSAPASPYWSRFCLIVFPVAGTKPWGPSRTWGSLTLWGHGKFGAPGTTIGTTATPAQVASVRSIVRDWKPAGTTCEWIITAFDSATFAPSGTTDPTGWENWSDGTGSPVRLSTARYWRGTSA